ncbi:hypothetical protein Dsin_008550 [Dipteronia sinensis]|uniref:Reverse transcriptase zinc-binding domain-containing protein n=1 Tax=Dipteronia sinensis TaxID=43782 RepID=A0AAE0APL2_9ROSI|nr:hypothetical protein Dsin_008550 [Dipteronia sinensis]
MRRLIVFCLPLVGLEQHFCSDDVLAIISIPIGSNGRMDSLIWHYDVSGVFTVKSGYHLARNLLPQAGHSNSGSNPCNDWWKALWQLNLPLKIKIFIWKACYNWIPTMSNLHHRLLLRTFALCVGNGANRLSTLCGAAAN